VDSVQLTASLAKALLTIALRVSAASTLTWRAKVVKTALLVVPIAIVTINALSVTLHTSLLMGAVTSVLMACLQIN